MTHLKEIKDLVVVVWESQQKMWGPIEGISKELQELVQGDIGTNGEEETELVPMTISLAEKELVPATKTSISPIHNKYNGSYTT